MTKKNKLVASWIPGEIVEEEKNYRKEYWEENTGDGSPCPSDEELCDSIQDDPCFFQTQWDNLMEHLTEIINKINPSGNWYVVVENFGWQKKNGQKEITVKTGEELIRQVLPDCENWFRIYRDGENRLIITNSHHDSPYGEECYHLCKNHPVSKRVMRKTNNI